MLSLKNFLNNRFNLFFIFSAVIVFCYLLFRSIYSSLVCDELTTFFRFIQPSFLLGDGSDANNHILNSILAYIPYRIFGFSSLSIRLFSLFSVLVYFVYVYRFSQLIQDRTLQVLFVLVMLFSLNFLQFFGLSRGYSFSFAFILGGLYHFYKFVKDSTVFKVKEIVFFQVYISFCLFANLATLLTTLTLTFFLFLFIIQKTSLLKQLKKSQKTIFITSCIFYLLVLLSMISYSFILKSNGALYYGNLQGFWYNVIVTQVYLLLENKSTFIQIVFFVFFSVFIAISIISQKNIKLKTLNHSNVFFIILIFNVVGIELLALILKVNYPSDRVAIHLFILFVLSLFFIDVDKNRLLKQLKFTLIILVCLIPIHNIITANYKKNTVWPLDYFPVSYYNKIIEAKVDPDFYPTVTGDHFRGLSYVKYVYENNGVGNLITPWEEQDSTVFDARNHPGKYSDFIISKAEKVESIRGLYSKVDSNDVNEICLWERIEKSSFSQVLEDSIKTISNAKDEFFDCAELVIDSLDNKYLLLDIEFDLEALELPFNGALIVNAEDVATNQTLLYESYSIRHQNSFKTNKKFRQRIVLKKLHPTDKLKISAYIWNLKKETVSINNGKVVFYEFLN